MLLISGRTQQSMVDHNTWSGQTVQWTWQPWTLLQGGCDVTVPHCHCVVVVCSARLIVRPLQFIAHLPWCHVWHWVTSLRCYALVAGRPSVTILCFVFIKFFSVLLKVNNFNKSVSCIVIYLIKLRYWWHLWLCYVAHASIEFDMDICYDPVSVMIFVWCWHCVYSTSCRHCFMLRHCNDICKRSIIYDELLWLANWLAIVGLLLVYCIEQ